MKHLVLLLSFIATLTAHSQDTFSIVAIDTVTGEVGSAGASCVDLFAAGYPNADFLSELFPGVGAINTQAAYLPSNQAAARNRMNMGETPDQIIAWLQANDAQSNPATRQYGVVRVIGTGSSAAAYTGSSCLNVAGHLIGPNYSIQGNILLNEQILADMEAGFNNTEGDLRCKLMGALQGANVAGADSRCASDGTSSLFAFIKVSQPTDAFGDPSFLLQVRTHDNSNIEPIDSLQTLFDAVVSNCTFLHVTSQHEELYSLYPNPANQQLTLSFTDPSARAD